MSVVPYCNFHIHYESCSYILCTSVLKSCLTRLCSVRATLLPLYCVLQRLGLKYASDILSRQHLPTVGWDSSSRWWPCQHEPVWSSGFTEPKVPHSPSQTPFYAAAQTHEVSTYFDTLMYSQNWDAAISCIFSALSPFFKCRHVIFKSGGWNLSSKLHLMPVLINN